MAHPQTEPSGSSESPKSNGSARTLGGQRLDLIVLEVENPRLEIWLEIEIQRQIKLGFSISTI